MLKKITLVILYFAISSCQTTTTNGIKNGSIYKSVSPKNPKSQLDDNKQLLHDTKMRKFGNKNVKQSSPNDVKDKDKNKKEYIRRLPKILKQSKLRASTRFTKMEMMQETEATTHNEVVDDEILSPYSIRQQLTRISKAFGDYNISVEVIGRTVEYNDIVLVKISYYKQDPLFRAKEDKYAEDPPQKKIIFIVHLLNVMGAPSVLCLYEKSWFLTLVRYYLTYLDKFDIFLLPLANPDGFTIAKENPIHNKNAAPQNECAGVALDRNFDVAWNNNRSLNSCHDEYPGPSAFSEPETRAIRDIFHKFGHKMVAYINVHPSAFTDSVFKGDSVLYPKGYAETTDDDKYIDLKAEIDDAIRNASFQVLSVTVDSMYNWYGRVTGTSVDYAATVYSVPFALEFLMQVYNDDNVSEDENYYSVDALTEIWQRVIDVTFNYIWKTTNNNDLR